MQINLDGYINALEEQNWSEDRITWVVSYLFLSSDRMRYFYVKHFTDYRHL